MVFSVCFQIFLSFLLFTTVLITAIVALTYYFKFLILFHEGFSFTIDELFSIWFAEVPVIFLRAVLLPCLVIDCELGVLETQEFSYTDQFFTDLLDVFALENFYSVVVVHS